MKKIKIYQPTKKGSAEMFSDFEKEVARDEMIENEIDDIREEKLQNKMWEDTEGEYPECHGDSPNQNMIGDPLN